MTLSDSGTPVADDPAPRHVGPSAPPLAPYVLPTRTEGYAQRSTIRSKLFALFITAALHVAALVGFMLYRLPGILVAPPPQPLVVTLLPLARPPAEMRRKDVQPKVVPAKPPLALSTPIARPILPDMTSPVLAEPDDVSPAPVSPTTPPAAEAAVAERAPASGTPGNARDSWEGRVLARLERFTRFPAAALSRRDQGVTTIRFRLDRQGRVLSSSIARISGSTILDQEALATLARAQPLPPIPADRPDEVELVVPIEFFLRHGG